MYYANACYHVPSMDTSRTGQAVALARARLSRPTTPEGDPEAQLRICEGIRTSDRFTLDAHVAARTRFFDDAVLGAIGDGVSQVVVLGAGYDDRALRFRAPGVRFLEVDHPGTQADKRERLARMGAPLDRLTLVPCDLSTPGLGEALADAGHDAGRPTLFTCEGLLIYLGRDVILATLGACAGRAAPGSVLAASLTVHDPAKQTAQVLSVANARRHHGETEPWRTILPADAHLELLRRAGWEPATITDQAEIDPAAPAGRSLFVLARPR